jgi:hypothetical protein
VISTATTASVSALIGPAARIPVSPALEWVWDYLSDVRRPHVLDCGACHASTAEVLLRRGAKLYVADLVSPLISGVPQLWDRSRKTPVFKLDALLRQLPAVPPGSLSLVLSWQILDLLPPDSLAPFVLHMHQYLRPGGVFLCIVRERHVVAGVVPSWRLETLTVLKNEQHGMGRFAYPALTSRQIERLLPTPNVKTFLTRSGFRETLSVTQDSDSRVNPYRQLSNSFTTRSTPT